MKISLLHPAQAGPRALPIGDRLCYHLSLDRAFAYVCPDFKQREVFFSVLGELTCDREEIRWRREVLQDLQADPTLLERLRALSSRFDALRISQEQSGREEARLRAGGDATVTAMKNILQAQALCFKRALLFVRGFEELLSGCDLHAEAWLRFRDACRELSQNPAFERMLTACTRYERFSTVGFLDFVFRLSESGQISAYELIDHRYLRITDPELKKKGFSLFKKAPEETAPCERVYPANGRAYGELTVSALSELSTLFSSLSAQIFSRFGSIGAELDFYEVALSYIRKLTEKGISPVFPSFSDDGTASVTGLYDLYLLLSSPSADGVVSNGYRVTEGMGGLAVFGSNGSGKTVFLRAVGTAQLLAQAGLPIPCEQAVLPLYTQIAAQFSHAEDIDRDHGAGRFEQEVRELSAMVETLRRGALVLLNETFQSTAYAEGAEGLYHLLEHFSACGIRWMLVSHLRQLEPMLTPQDAAILHTADGYRILP